MTVRLNPYINFRGQARDAIDFYHAVFGGELAANTYSEFGMEVKPDEADMIMHAQLEIPGGMTLMVADATSEWEFAEGRAPFSISLSGDDEPLLRSWWDGLAEGATIEQPLTPAPWGDTFGSLVDKFGINWIVNISPAAA